MFDTMDPPKSPGGPSTRAADDRVDATGGPLSVRLLSAPEKVDALVSVQRQIAHLQFVAARLAAAIGDDFPGTDDWAREEISAALRISGYAADQLLRVGRALADRLPAMAAALDTGAISFRHAVVLTDAAAPFDAATATELEEAALPIAVAETPGRFARQLDREVIAADSRAAQIAHAHAVAARELVIYPQPCGMATVAATMAAPAARALFAAVDAQAGSAGPDDDRPVGARRVDVLESWAMRVLAGVPDSGSTSTPTRQGRPVQVNVTMTLATALGLADTPAELAGYGPITAEAARALAGEGAWRAFVVDAATGALTHIGTTRYEPTQALRDFIAARDPVCAHPHCNQPFDRCDVDHAVPWPEGETCQCNCGPVCRRHHRCKHEGGWRLSRDPDGTAHWISPLGFRYDKRPAHYPVD